MPPLAPRCNVGLTSRHVILVAYAIVTLLDLVRAVIHTFLYEMGLDDVSGLATGDALCDGRLASLMIAYGGANFESFVVRAYVLYDYARLDARHDLVRVTSLVSVATTPILTIVAAVGDVDVGDADLPGRYAMFVRSFLSLVAFLLTWA